MTNEAKLMTLNRMWNLELHERFCKKTILKFPTFRESKADQNWAQFLAESNVVTSDITLKCQLGQGPILQN